MVKCFGCKEEISTGEEINIYERGTFCGGNEDDYSDKVVCMDCVDAEDENASYAYCMYCGEEAAFNKKDLKLIFDGTAFACREHKDEGYDEYE